eukprot:COSAG06_NODE_245_length_19176_cov_167.625151_11_plen_310_part_00
MALLIYGSSDTSLVSLPPAPLANLVLSLSLSPPRTHVIISHLIESSAHVCGYCANIQVEADWNSFGTWYPGVITDSVEASHAAGDGSPASGAKTYTVKYDDDSVELGVPAALIRPARGGGGALIAEGAAGGRAKGRSYEAPAYEAWGAYVGLEGIDIADEESTTATLQEGRRPGASSRREMPGAREEARASRRERRGRSMAGSSAGPGGRRPSSHERERRSSETRAASSRPIRSAEFAFERHGRSGGGGGGGGGGRRGSRRSGSEIGPRRGGAVREGEVAAARPRAASAELAQTTSLPTVMERRGGSED